MAEYTEKDHEDYLTELFGTINICGLEYPAGQALNEIDPIAFRVSMADEAPEEEEEDDALLSE